MAAFCVGGANGALAGDSGACHAKRLARFLALRPAGLRRRSRTSEPVGPLPDQMRFKRALQFPGGGRLCLVFHYGLVRAAGAALLFYAPRSFSLAQLLGAAGAAIPAPSLLLNFSNSLIRNLKAF